MELRAREMLLSEVDTIIDYFHQSSPEYLNMLGVDPTRLPDPVTWRERYVHEYSQPIEKRKTFLVAWEAENGVVGFSTTDRIVYGEEAYMHLHVLDPGHRRKGMGAAFVRETARLYFETLKLERLFCQPNALNVAPNRTLQKAGFRYVKTYMTVPGPLNFHQAVTCWIMKREWLQASRPRGRWPETRP